MSASQRDEAAERNLELLVQLRWLAVGGQLATIVGVHLFLRIDLPLVPMLATLLLLVVLNLTVLAARQRRAVTNLQLLAGMLVDVGGLTVQLYLSGGATNPFVTLYLLQVVLGAVLLEVWSSWTLVALTSGALGLLAIGHRPLPLPPGFESAFSRPYLATLWFNYTLAAVLLVAFVTRIARNLRTRDAHLAELRQRAAEEEQIVRMGLLASGAAHELGTPLSSLSVALGDWRQEAAVLRDQGLSEEVADMQAEVARCKEIVAGILFAAGEVTGQAPRRTTLRRFVRGVVEGSGRAEMVSIDDRLPMVDPSIVADRALAQALSAILDNAAEAGAGALRLSMAMEDGQIRLCARDDGPGIAPRILTQLGRPYQTTKARRGAGLGLFLATNVLRTLGGTLTARNPAGGGAEIVLALPYDALALPDEAS